MEPSPRDRYQNKCAKRDLSDAIDVSPSDTWLREEASIFIGQAKSTEIVISCRGPRFHQFWEINGSDLIALVDGPHFSRDFLFKNNVFSLLLLTFNQMVKKLSDFEGRS